MTAGLPESDTGANRKPGPRLIVLCLRFFEAPESKEHLPTNNKEIDEYCKTTRRKISSNLRLEVSCNCRKTWKDGDL
jgi:hypothetical protein